MSYNSGIDQRFRDQIFYNNSVAEDQPITSTNLSLIANLKYVQNWLSSVIVNYLPIVNPNFIGTLTSSTGGNISLTNPISYLSVPTITSNTNFTGIPTIQTGSVKSIISVVKIGEIKMFISNMVPNNLYLKCDGSLYAVADYTDLFNIIQYTYGGGGDYFAVPNFSSAFPIGANSQNNLGCGLSNFATGNGQTGAFNTYSTSSNFAGGPIAQSPILQVVPQHTHAILDNGHVHRTLLIPNFIVATPALSPLPSVPYSGVNPPYYTQNAYTGITIQGQGQNIQAIDPISNIAGVNITPPFVAVFFYICGRN
jgi:microcystin-dependent protein